MSGGKGGGADAGAMLQYGKKALKLQKEMYDYSKEVSQPWLQTGTSAINQLANYMGLPTASAGTATKTRDQLLKELTPQYTTTSGSSGNLYYTPDGRVVDVSKISKPRDYTQVYGQAKNSSEATKNYQSFNRALLSGDWTQAGFKPLSTQTSSINYDALNSAVDAVLANQTPAATPEGYGKLMQTFTPSDLYTDPSYQWRLDQGTKAAERQLAASGKYLTPAASQALTEVGQNMGSQEYQAAYNRFNNDQTSLYNRLAALAGMGQTQTGQVIGAGGNYANSATDLYTGMGNAITAAQQANAANSGSMFNTLLGTAGQIGAAYFMSDENLKQDIKPVGVENGHNVYEFAYKSDPYKKYIGVMAQEVLKTNPEAVTEIGGYYAVDYNKIGVKFREV